MLWLTNEDLPKSVSINSKEWFVDTDFRAWIRFEEVLTDSSIKDEWKLLILCNSVSLDPCVLNYYKEEDVFNALFSFYRMFKPRLKASTSRNDEIPYKYSSDIGYVYSAFLQQYGINILKSDMHWFEYKSLFDSLTDATKFVQIIGYRMQDVSKMEKEQKKQAIELKKMYQIVDEEYEEEKERTPQQIEAELLAKLQKGR